MKIGIETTKLHKSRSDQSLIKNLWNSGMY